MRIEHILYFSFHLLKLFLFKKLIFFFSFIKIISISSKLNYSLVINLPKTLRTHSIYTGICAKQIRNVTSRARVFAQMYVHIRMLRDSVL